MPDPLELNLLWLGIHILKFDLSKSFQIKMTGVKWRELCSKDDKTRMNPGARNLRILSEESSALKIIKLNYGEPWSLEFKNIKWRELCSKDDKTRMNPGAWICLEFKNIKWRELLKMIKLN